METKLPKMKDFSWGTVTFWHEVPSGGFEWREDLRLARELPKRPLPGNERGPYLTARDYFGPGYGGADSRIVGELRPRRSDVGLHRVFAALPPEAEAILAFANVYGPLGLGPLLEDPSVPELSAGRDAYGEGLAFWQRQIAKMNSLTTTWDQVANGSSGALAELVTWRRAGRGPTGKRVTVAIPHWKEYTTFNPMLTRAWGYGKVLEPVRWCILRTVNSLLNDGVSPQLVNHAVGPTLRDFPDCLLYAMYAAFALEIAGVLPAAQQCKHYQEKMDPLCPHSRTAGMFAPKSHKADFCSDYCRNRNWRIHHRGGPRP